MRSRAVSFLLLVLVVCTNILAQQPNSAYQAYINQYAPIAQQQMRTYGIPASITLAQGLLESAAGQSMLARTANNHFGIKVTSDWTGPYVLRTDDRPDEKFRSYASAAESYEDHSRFLQRPRYKQLYSLKRDDYKGWAQTLKACGYATSPTYAQNLINIIELYNLQTYDSGHVATTPAVKGEQITCDPAVAVQTLARVNTRQEATTSIYDFIRFCNGKRYVVAQAHDTWKSISKISGVSARKLRKYNEYPAGFEPTSGTPIYLDNKATHAAKSLRNKCHVVQSGESMHSISQLYGMRMKTLYKLNNLPSYYSPQPGDKLRLR